MISLCLFFSYRIRVPWPFQWGAPSFDAGEAFAMMMASFVALVEVCDYLLLILIFRSKLIMLCYSVYLFIFFRVWLIFKVNRWFYRCLKICKCNNVATFYSQPRYWLAGNLATLEIIMLLNKYRLVSELIMFCFFLDQGVAILISGLFGTGAGSSVSM